MCVCVIGTSSSTHEEGNFSPAYKQLENQTKYLTQLFQTLNSSQCRSVIPERQLPCDSTGREIIKEPRSLTELRRPRFGFKKAKVVRSCRAKYQKGGSCSVSSGELQAGIWVFACKLCTCVGWKKNHQKTVGHTISEVYTGRGIVHTSSIQSGDTSKYPGHWHWIESTGA